MEVFVRLGYLAKAIVYLLVGTLALRVAAGLRGGRLTDPDGSLYVVLRQPLGNTLLFLIAAGFLAYATWRLVGAAMGVQPRNSASYTARFLVGVRALVYGAIGVKAVKLATGLSGGESGPETLVRAAMGWPLGQWLLLAAGVAVAWYGALEIRSAMNGHLEEDLDAASLRRRAGDWALGVARAGVGARGVILVLLAWGVIRAAVSHQAAAAGGMDTSLRVLSALPQGALLLGATAAGLVAYGLYQLLHARYATI